MSFMNVMNRYSRRCYKINQDIESPYVVVGFVYRITKEMLYKRESYQDPLFPIDILGHNLMNIPEEVQQPKFNSPEEKFEQYFEPNLIAYFESNPKKTWMTVGLYLIIRTYDRRIEDFYFIPHFIKYLYIESFENIVLTTISNKWCDVRFPDIMKKYQEVLVQIETCMKEGRYYLTYDFETKKRTISEVEEDNRYIPTELYYSNGVSAGSTGGITWYLYKTNDTKVKVLVYRRNRELAFAVCC